MDKKELKRDKESRPSNEAESEQPFEHESNKKGQRQGGIDKHGNKEKDEHGEF